MQLDVGDRDFEREVIERSRTVPVVVDFWAPWCAPCRALGPLLERLAAESDGQFVLAKVNVDDNPAVSRTFGVQSIPMVIGFRDGQPVAQFVGALPESGVRDFLTRVLPDEVELLAKHAAELLAAGDKHGAEDELRRALALNGRCAPALLALAAVHADRQEYEEALGLLERIESGALRGEADRMAAEIRIRMAGGGDQAELVAKVEADPTDLEARFALAQWFAANRSYEEALRQYLEIVRLDRRFRDDAARKAMLDVFELLGPGEELVDRYRSELGKVLFR